MIRHVILKFVMNLFLGKLQGMVFLYRGLAEVGLVVFVQTVLDLQTDNVVGFYIYIF